MATDIAKGRAALEQPVKPVVRKRPSKTLTMSPSTGPRTLRGKQKSRYNALKHGIFAQVVLRGTALKESKETYLNLLESFRESFHPVGGVEELLVEKLAMLAWRKARAVRAEAAMVMKQTEFFREDREACLKDASQGDMARLAALTGGMARRRENPYLLTRSIRLLETIATLILSRGFVAEQDERLLEILYGEAGRAEGLFSRYRVCSSEAAEASESSVKEKCKREFLDVLEKEVGELEASIADLETREDKELPLIEESLAIPGEKELDRLLRYETRLDGSFDRTLQQIERLQRIRQGQPLPPTLKVDVTQG